MKDTNILTNAGVNLDASLELFGDIETYNETLVDFQSEVSNKLNDIKKYKELMDMPNYAILVHSLKSDAKYFGFTKLAELSYQHELESKAGHTEFVSKNYDELMREANAIVELVNQYLNGGTAEAKSFKSNNSNRFYLVVDDSNVICKFIEKIFDGEMECIFANDGNEAINIINKSSGNIEGIFLDLNMPRVDGFAVLEKLNEKDLFKHIPVAIFTGDEIGRAHV